MATAKHRPAQEHAHTLHLPDRHTSATKRLYKINRKWFVSEVHRLALRGKRVGKHHKLYTRDVGVGAGQIGIGLDDGLVQIEEKRFHDVTRNVAKKGPAAQRERERENDAVLGSGEWLLCLPLSLAFSLLMSLSLSLSLLMSLSLARSCAVTLGISIPTPPPLLSHYSFRTFLFLSVSRSPFPSLSFVPSPTPPRPLTERDVAVHRCHCRRVGCIG